MDLSLSAQDLAHTGPRRVWPRRRDPLLVAVFAVVVSAAGAGRPSLWYDEAATISASTRSVAELWRMVHHVDAVHGVYYLAMHGWFTVVPPTEFLARLSSCLAVGVAAAGVVVLGSTPAPDCGGRLPTRCPTVWASMSSSAGSSTSRRW